MHPLDSAPPKNALWRVASASFAGTTIEYYDFAIYGLASALVFPAVFFSASDPLTGTLGAFATFAVGFVARPLGGILFGHFGDKVGRKPILVFTLVLMGVASTAIGLLPGYAQIGVAAPILLVTLRIVQGVAFGGEWGGAVLMAFEYATPGRRGLFASLPQVGPAAGALIGNAVFALVALLPQDQLLSWGWRIPFLASAVLVVIGLLIRLKIAESPEFTAAKSSGRETRVPILHVLRHDLGRAALVMGGFLGFGAFAGLAITYMVTYATATVGVPASSILPIILIANAVQLPLMILSGFLADRIGFRPLMIAGPIIAIVGVFVLFAGVNTGQWTLMLLAYVFAFGVGYTVCAGAQPALFADAFTPEVRYTGMSLGYTLANVLGTGILPFVAALLLAATGSGYAIAAYVAVLLVVSLVCLNLLITVSRRRVRAVGVEAAESVDTAGAA